MNIAHLVPPGVHAYSGLLAALVELAAAQARHGHAVEVWEPGGWPVGAEDLRAVLEEASVTLVRFEVGRNPFRIGAAAARSIADRIVDVVHIHGVFNPYNNTVARRLLVPYIVSPHGGYAAESLSYHALRKRVFGQVFERPMLRRARAVCALTAAEAVEVRRYAQPHAVWIIPNGVTPPARDVDRQAFRRELGWSPDDRLAVFVGRLDVRAKRLADVVRAIAGSPEWRLAVIGGDFRGGEAHLSELIGQLGIAARARLTGPRRGTALQAALAAADLFILVSRSEGMPMALLEAAANGLPALVSAEVERATGVAVSGAGWVTNVADLTRTLTSLAVAPREEWERRGAAAFAYASRYDWALIAAEYDAMYRASGIMPPGAEVDPNHARASGSTRG